MKTQLIPVLMTAVLAATAAQARPNDDDGDRQHQRAERPQMAAPQQQPQQQPPQAPAQPQPQAQPRQRERERSGAQTGQSDAQRAGRGWIPGDPNHPSAPRGNPTAGSQGSQGAAQPTPAAPRAGGNGAQGSGQQAAERSWRGNRPQGSNQGSNQRPNWQADRGRAQNRNQQRDWRDSQGHDWRANRGWYDRYRVDHYRYDGGRYFARQRYSLGFYAYPRGYSTRLWLAGEWLPSAFFIDGRYDIGNYWFYDLYEPPLGCRWTRVGNDALLIDEETGEVLDVVYDLFW